LATGRPHDSRTALQGERVRAAPLFPEGFSMFITPAYAQGSAPSSGASAFMSFAPLILIFIIFYFLLIRPQQKRMKAHQAMIADAQVRDEVVTNGGLVGKVTKVDEHYLEIEVAQGVKVKVVKSMLADIRKHGAKAAND
jgi:preprotein translocase subunit YajC